MERMCDGENAHRPARAAGLRAAERTPPEGRGHLTGGWQALSLLSLQDEQTGSETRRLFQDIEDEFQIHL